MENNNVKEFDFFLLNQDNPEATTLDYTEQGFSGVNTQLLTPEEYKSKKSIQERFQTDNGKFDEVAFNKAYNTALFEYNKLVNPEEAYPEVYSYLDSRAYKNPEKPKIVVNPFSTYVLPSYNTFEQDIGIEAINKVSDPTKTVSEIAQHRKIYDPETGEFIDKTPEDLGLKYLFNDNLFLATWDEDGTHIDVYGNEVKHAKGEYKLDSDNKPYYEFQRGRNLSGKQVLGVGNILTKEDTLANEFDFFDSDDIKKTVFGSFMKSVANTVPYFIPYVNVGIVAKDIIDLIPSAIGMGYGVLTNKEEPEWLNFWEGLTKKTNETGVSQYSQENMITWENLFSLAGDVVVQLKGQNTIFKAFQGKAEAKFAKQAESAFKKYEDKLEEVTEVIHKVDNAGKSVEVPVKMIKLDGKLYNISKDELRNAVEMAAKAESFKGVYSKTGEQMSKAYMALMSASNSYWDAREAGWDPRMAGLIGLTSTAMYRSILELPYSEWIFPNKEINTIATRKTIQDVLKDTKILEAGMKASKNPTPGIINGFQKQFLKESKVAYEANKKWYNKFIDKLTKGKVKSIDQAIQESEPKYIRSAKTFFSNIGAEALEEDTEQLAQDMIYDGFSFINDVFKTNTTGEVENMASWRNGTFIQEYVMNALGGAIGGAVGGITKVQNIGKLYKGNGNADQNLITAIRNGQKDELIKEVRNIQNTKDHSGNMGGFGSNILSMEIDDELSTDSNYVFKAANDKLKSQNDTIADALVNQIELTSKILGEEDLDFTNKDVVQKILEKEINFGRIYSLSSTSPVFTQLLRDYNDLTTAIVQTRLDLNNLEPLTDMQKRNASEKEIEDVNVKRQFLQKELEELRKKRTDWLEEGSKAREYASLILYSLKPSLRSLDTPINVDEFALFKYGVSIDDLNERDTEYVQDKFDEYLKNGGTDILRMQHKKFMQLNEALSPTFREILNTEATQNLKDSEEFISESIKDMIKESQDSGIFSAKEAEELRKKLSFDDVFTLLTNKGDSKGTLQVKTNFVKKVYDAYKNGRIKTLPKNIVSTLDNIFEWFDTIQRPSVTLQSAYERNLYSIDELIPIKKINSGEFKSNTITENDVRAIVGLLSFVNSDLYLKNKDKLDSIFGLNKGQDYNLLQALQEFKKFLKDENITKASNEEVIHNINNIFSPFISKELIPTISSFINNSIKDGRIKDTASIYSLVSEEILKSPEGLASLKSAITSNPFFALPIITAWYNDLIPEDDGKPEEKYKKSGITRNSFSLTDKKTLLEILDSDYRLDFDIKNGFNLEKLLSDSEKFNRDLKGYYHEDILALSTERIHTMIDNMAKSDGYLISFINELLNRNNFILTQNANAAAINTFVGDTSQIKPEVVEELSKLFIDETLDNDQKKELSDMFTEINTMEATSEGELLQTFLSKVPKKLLDEYDLSADFIRKLFTEVDSLKEYILPGEMSDKILSTLRLIDRFKQVVWAAINNPTTWGYDFGFNSDLNTLNNNLSSDFKGTDLGVITDQQGYLLLDYLSNIQAKYQTAYNLSEYNKNNIINFVPKTRLAVYSTYAKDLYRYCQDLGIDLTEYSEDYDTIAKIVIDNDYDNQDLQNKAFTLFETLSNKIRNYYSTFTSNEEIIKDLIDNLSNNDSLQGKTRQELSRGISNSISPFFKESTAHDNIQILLTIVSTTDEDIKDIYESVKSFDNVYPTTEQIESIKGNIGFLINPELWGEYIRYIHSQNWSSDLSSSPVLDTIRIINTGPGAGKTTAMMKTSVKYYLDHNPDRSVAILGVIPSHVKRAGDSLKELPNSDRINCNTDTLQEIFNLYQTPPVSGSAKEAQAKSGEIVDGDITYKYNGKVIHYQDVAEGSEEKTGVASAFYEITSTKDSFKELFGKEDPLNNVDVIIIDEATYLSQSQLVILNHYAKLTGKSLLLFGDTHQPGNDSSYIINQAIGNPLNIGTRISSNFRSGSKVKRTNQNRINTIIEQTEHVLNDADVDEITTVVDKTIPLDFSLAFNETTVQGDKLILESRLNSEILDKELPKILKLNGKDEFTYAVSYDSDEAKLSAEDFKSKLVNSGIPESKITLVSQKDIQGSEFTYVFSFVDLNLNPDFAVYNNLGNLRVINMLASRSRKGTFIITPESQPIKEELVDKDSVFDLFKNLPEVAKENFLNQFELLSSIELEDDTQQEGDGESEDGGNQGDGGKPSGKNPPKNPIDESKPTKKDIDNRFVDTTPKPGVGQTISTETTLGSGKSGEDSIQDSFGNLTEKTPRKEELSRIAQKDNVDVADLYQIHTSAVALGLPRSTTNGKYNIKETANNSTDLRDIVALCYLFGKFPNTSKISLEKLLRTYGSNNTEGFDFIAERSKFIDFFYHIINPANDITDLDEAFINYFGNITKNVKNVRLAIQSGQNPKYNLFLESNKTINDYVNTLMISFDVTDENNKVLKTCSISLGKFNYISTQDNLSPNKEAPNRFKFWNTVFDDKATLKESTITPIESLETIRELFPANLNLDFGQRPYFEKFKDDEKVPITGVRKNTKITKGTFLVTQKAAGSKAYDRLCKELNIKGVDRGRERQFLVKFQYSRSYTSKDVNVTEDNIYELYGQTVKDKNGNEYPAYPWIRPILVSRREIDKPALVKSVKEYIDKFPYKTKKDDLQKAFKTLIAPRCLTSSQIESFIKNIYDNVLTGEDTIHKRVTRDMLVRLLRPIDDKEFELYNHISTNEATKKFVDEVLATREKQLKDEGQYIDLFDRIDLPTLIYCHIMAVRDALTTRIGFSELAQESDIKSFNEMFMDYLKVADVTTEANSARLFQEAKITKEVGNETKVYVVDIPNNSVYIAGLPVGEQFYLNTKVFNESGLINQSIQPTPPVNKPESVFPSFNDISVGNLKTVGKMQMAYGESANIYATSKENIAEILELRKNGDSTLEDKYYWIELNKGNFYFISKDEVDFDVPIVSELQSVYDYEGILVKKGTTLILTDKDNRPNLLKYAVWSLLGINDKVINSLEKDFIRIKKIVDNAGEEIKVELFITPEENCPDINIDAQNIVNTVSVRSNIITDIISKNPKLSENIEQLRVNATYDYFNSEDFIVIFQREPGKRYASNQESLIKRLEKDDNYELTSINLDGSTIKIYTLKDKVESTTYSKEEISAIENSAKESKFIVEEDDITKQEGIVFIGNDISNMIKLPEYQYYSFLDNLIKLNDKLTKLNFVLFFNDGVCTNKTDTGFFSSPEEYHVISKLKTDISKQLLTFKSDEGDDTLFDLNNPKMFNISKTGISEKDLTEIKEYVEKICNLVSINNGSINDNCL